MKITEVWTWRPRLSSEEFTPEDQDNGQLPHNDRGGASQLERKQKSEKEKKNKS